MKNILFIDDQTELLSTLKTIFTRFDMELTPAENGAEALKILKSSDTRFDLIIVDQNMPVMDGPEFLAELKKLSEYDTVPCFLYTGDVNPQFEERYRRLGVVEIIEKPLLVRQLIEKINSHL